MMRRLLPVTLFAALAVAGCSSSSENSGGAVGSGRTNMPQQGYTGSQVGHGQLSPIDAARQELTSTVGDRVFFATDSTSLDAQGRATLDKQVAWLNRYPMVQLTIEGHADERGTREYNLALGDRRAQAAKTYLTDHGIAAGRLRTISYGKERPVAVGSDEASWAQNRRAVSVVQQ